MRLHRGFTPVGSGSFRSPSSLSFALPSNKGPLALTKENNAEAHTPRPNSMQKTAYLLSLTENFHRYYFFMHHLTVIEADVGVKK